MVLAVVAASVACDSERAPVVCGRFSFEAVASAPDGDLLLAGESNGALAPTVSRLPPRGTLPTPPQVGPYVLRLAPNGDVIWVSALPGEDGTPVGLALSPTAVGVVASGGGAAATRFNDLGALAWIVGYPRTSAVRTAVTSDDKVVVVDAGAVRAFLADGRGIWAVGLPEGVLETPAVVADRQGGVWLAGGYSGNGFAQWLAPPVPPSSPPSSAPVSDSGVFVMHLDGAGQLLGGGAWPAGTRAITFTGAVLAVTSGGDERLLVTGSYQAAAFPELMLPAPPVGTPGFMAVAFDGGGRVLWGRLATQSPTLIPDGEGAVMVLQTQLDHGDFSTGPDVILRAARWDLDGMETATNSMLVSPGTDRQTLSWTAAAGHGMAGAIIAGQLTDTATCSNQRHLLFRVRSPDLGFEALPLNVR